jgi:hypothetical protein
LGVACDGLEKVNSGVGSFREDASGAGGGGAEGFDCGLEFGVVDVKLKAGRLAPENGTFGTAGFGA